MTLSAHGPSESSPPMLDGDGVAMPAGAQGTLGPPAALRVILIVEDDHTVARIFRDILEEDGYAVLHADRGDAALAILASPFFQLALVLLDVNLPDMDGFQLLRTIREGAPDPRLPVIIATARGMPADRAAAIKATADDFLVKPVLPEELLLKVRTLLFRRNLERQALQLEGLCRMFKAVNSSLHLNVVLDRGLEHTIAALAADGGLIRLYDRKQDALSLRTHYGIPPELVAQLMLTPAAPEFLSLPAPCMVNLFVRLPGSSPSFHKEMMLFREARYGGAALIPLETKAAVAGILSIYTRNQPAATDQDIAFLTAVGDLISTAMENACLHEEVTSRALTDALTNLPNRRHFEHRLREELRRALRSGRPLAVLLMDLDQFKEINDSRGHLVGDQILSRVAATLVATGRATDFLARYGGDEFVALLPESPREAACQAAERLRKAVEEHSYSIGMPGESLRLTISIGLATVPEKGSTPKVVIERADRALYRAKHGGRNCVRAATDDSPRVAGPPQSTEKSPTKALEGGQT